MGAWCSSMQLCYLGWGRVSHAIKDCCQEIPKGSCLSIGDEVNLAQGWRPIHLEYRHHHKDTLLQMPLDQGSYDALSQWSHCACRCVCTIHMKFPFWPIYVVIPTAHHMLCSEKVGQDDIVHIREVHLQGRY